MCERKPFMCASRPLTDVPVRAPCPCVCPLNDSYTLNPKELRQHLTTPFTFMTVTQRCFSLALDIEDGLVAELLSLQAVLGHVLEEILEGGCPIRGTHLS